MFSVATNVADIATLKAARAAAETNIEDLTESARVTCTTLDTIASPDMDCCISGPDTAAYGDRDKFLCMSRAAAGILLLDTANSCQVCPAGVIS